ncbi:hypothetical protein BJY52DRAFT_1231582 [Lactarius psammicola]|nr:hypothetical protein BJY52DRAFT_1231582 [Lactarius psammicola]
MGTHGTKASSPELLATWRGLAAQGSMGQEAREGRWAEAASSPELLVAWRGLTAQRPVGQEDREGRWAGGTQKDKSNLSEIQYRGPLAIILQIQAESEWVFDNHAEVSSHEKLFVVIKK